MLVGLIALSVEIRMNLVTPCAAAHSATRKVPNTLFHTASTMLDSSIGTCLYAAVWNTYSGRYVSKVSSRRSGLVMLAMTGMTSTSGLVRATSRWVK